MASFKKQVTDAELIGITTNEGSVFCLFYQNLKLSINEVTLFELSRFFLKGGEIEDGTN